MRLNSYKAVPEDKPGFQKTFKWCQKHNHFFGGFPYDDPLAGPDGIHLMLLVPEGTPVEACQRALKAAYASQDVVRHTTTFSPREWFTEVGLMIEEPPVPNSEPGPGL